jgi:hypothetical protein
MAPDPPLPQTRLSLTLLALTLTSFQKSLEIKLLCGMSALPPKADKARRSKMTYSITSSAVASNA